jgi:hypothetical protein
MENKINIAEILKDCPKGMELDCSVWNNVVFDHIDTTSNYPIYIKKMGGELEYLTEDGHFNFDCDAKCVIFPKGKTTWEGFQRPFKDGDILVGRSKQPFIFEKLNDGDGCYSYCGISCVGEFVLASTDWTFANSLRFATEEEKKKLFDAIKDNGYKWNADTKTLEKLVEPKFKVGDRIKAICNNCQYDIKEITDTHYNLVEVEYKLKYTEPISEDKNWELAPNKFDINTFKPKDGDILISGLEDNPFIFKRINGLGNAQCYCAISCFGQLILNNDNWTCIKGCRLATEEEKSKLFQAIKDNGYKWNEETKTLEKLVEPKFKVGDRIKEKQSNIIGEIIDVQKNKYNVRIDDKGLYLYFREQDNWELVPNKFDITTLKPFESRVLVRDRNNDEWRGQFFSHYNNCSDRPYICVGNEGLAEYKQCIPYEGNEHLLGTTNDCDNYYKTW